MGINYAAATTVQLRAEIAGAGRSIRNVAAELGVDYTTLFRAVTGGRPIRVQTVFDLLEVLGVTPGVFFARVQERAERVAEETAATHRLSRLP
ncbi:MULTISPECIES: helix-turn-helix transcriptional regulator [unclassified Microbacterium]|uniref:helix-turn-helix domain-containing protein n=1 Tax=unclassified Microbacterium TaxID=2609290 RepID=UPI001657276C|nr:MULTISPECIES: helix-turn-helix transcriptional regulator [unclassified Microbacterium]MCT1366056.1 helix-turn-helix domain-containing protein [Microbacterium sp. p3-SID131]MCT1377224.1 helix-turn-helix domain-containing protein [Microbacterium sp. p3-SID337]